MLKKIGIWIAVVATAFLLNFGASAAEGIFCAIAGGIGAAAFLFVRPRVPVKVRLQRIGMWDVTVPLLLLGYLVFLDPGQTIRYAIWWVFLTIFFVGMRAGLTLAFDAPK